MSEQLHYVDASLSDCVNYESNPDGDCGGRMLMILDYGKFPILCENCYNKKNHTFEVQVGYGKGSYKSKYLFENQHLQSTEPFFWYNGLNTHSGHKKRLLRDGKVIARYIS